MELSLWNLHRNVENFTRNTLVMDGSTRDELKPLKIQNMILVQWSTHNKKYWKFGNIEYQKNTKSQTLLYCLSQLPTSVDYQTLARLKIDWTCQNLNLSSILPTHLFLLFTIDIFALGFFAFSSLSSKQQFDLSFYFFSSFEAFRLFLAIH